MGCAFCELGVEPFARNLSPVEMRDQADLVLGEARLRGWGPEPGQLKITVANGGEPLLNPRLPEALGLLGELGASFKVSTVLPRGNRASETLTRAAEFAAGYGQPVQLQISLISTDEAERIKLSGGAAADFATVRRAAETWRTLNPSGRKVNLSLIVSATTPCDVAQVAEQFPAELFRFRFREYVPTMNGTGHGLEAVARERLVAIKDGFRQRGYDVFDDASPTATERKFGLVANAVRRMYLDMTRD